MAEINDTYDIIEAIKRIEKELMESMVRNLDHHRAEEVKEGIRWSQWQVAQLKALEQYKKRNAKKYGTVFKDINAQIDVLISLQRQAGAADQEIAILESIKKGFPAKRVSKGMVTEFFKLNDRKINALIEATKNDMKNGQTAILRMANDKYRQVIFNAQMYAASGATYKQAVDMATKDYLAAGINCIEYQNGARHTLSEYADMALRTAQKRAYLTGEGEMRAEWGISTVIMNKRLSPCPKCLPFVGKVLIDDVWSNGKPSDGPYPLMSNAVARGLYHPRCRDSHTTYFPGISTPPDDTFTKKEVKDITNQQKNINDYQYAKRQEGKYERLANGSLDEENKRKYAAKKDEWQERAKELEKSNGVREDTQKIKGKDILEKTGKSSKITIKEGKKLSLNNLDEFQEWESEYYSLNSDLVLSRENFPNINSYTGSSYEGINAVERYKKGSIEYERYDRSYHGIEQYKAVSDSVSEEISRFKNTTDLQVYRSVGEVSYITGTTSSLEDMVASIGKEYIEKGFTSTTVCSDTTLPFGGFKDTKTKLEIYVPKKARGAYVYKISDSPAEFEYLIDKNTTFKVVDAGVREVEVKDFRGNIKKTQERYMKLEVVIDD